MVDLRQRKRTLGWVWDICRVSPVRWDEHDELFLGMDRHGRLVRLTAGDLPFLCHCDDPEKCDHALARKTLGMSSL